MDQPLLSQHKSNDHRIQQTLYKYLEANKWTAYLITRHQYASSFSCEVSSLRRSVRTVKLSILAAKRLGREFLMLFGAKVAPFMTRCRQSDVLSPPTSPCHRVISSALLLLVSRRFNKKNLKLPSCCQIIIHLVEPQKRRGLGIIREQTNDRGAKQGPAPLQPEIKSFLSKSKRTLMNVKIDANRYHYMKSVAAMWQWASQSCNIITISLCTVCMWLIKLAIPYEHRSKVSAN